MNWCEVAKPDQQPNMREISAFVQNPAWDALCGSVEERYGVAPKVEYSKCAAAPGWNVKYKKGGKSLCVLYPEQGAFFCLVVIGNKEQIECELLLPALDRTIQELYERTRFACGGRWLMIRIESNDIMQQALQLIELRTRKS